MYCLPLDEFKSYAAQRPEYAKIFSVYHELKILKNNIEIDKLAISSSTANFQTDETSSDLMNHQQVIQPATTLIKRPQSGDKERDDSTSNQQNQTPIIPKKIEIKGD